MILKIQDNYCPFNENINVIAKVSIVNGFIKAKL